MKEAQKLVAQAARSQEYLGQSKGAAEAIIAELFGELGWSLEVRWTDPQDKRSLNERQMALKR